MTIEIRVGDRKAAFAAPLNAYGAGSPYVPPLFRVGRPDKLPGRPRHFRQPVEQLIV